MNFVDRARRVLSSFSIVVECGIVDAEFLDQRVQCRAVEVCGVTLASREPTRYAAPQVPDHLQSSTTDPGESPSSRSLANYALCSVCVKCRQPTTLVSLGAGLTQKATTGEEGGQEAPQSPWEHQGLNLAQELARSPAFTPPSSRRPTIRSVR